MDDSKGKFNKNNKDRWINDSSELNKKQSISSVDSEVFSDERLQIILKYIRENPKKFEKCTTDNIIKIAQAYSIKDMEEIENIVGFEGLLLMILNDHNLISKNKDEPYYKEDIEYLQKAMETIARKISRYNIIDDFSIESLDYLGRFLQSEGRLEKTREEREQILNVSSAYIGEVIRNMSDKSFKWMNFDVAIKEGLINEPKDYFNSIFLVNEVGNAIKPKESAFKVFQGYEFPDYISTLAYMVSNKNVFNSKKKVASIMEEDSIIESINEENNESYFTSETTLKKTIIEELKQLLLSEYYRKEAMELSLKTYSIEQLILFLSEDHVSDVNFNYLVNLNECMESLSKDINKFGLEANFSLSSLRKLGEYLELVDISAESECDFEDIILTSVAYFGEFLRVSSNGVYRWMDNRFLKNVGLDHKLINPYDAVIMINESGDQVNPVSIILNICHGFSSASHLELLVDMLSANYKKEIYNPNSDSIDYKSEVIAALTRVIDSSTFVLDKIDYAENMNLKELYYKAVMSVAAVISRYKGDSESYNYKRYVELCRIVGVKELKKETIYGIDEDYVFNLFKEAMNYTKLFFLEKGYDFTGIKSTTKVFLHGFTVLCDDKTCDNGAYDKAVKVLEELSL